MPLRLLLEYVNKVDIHKWGKDFDPNDEENWNTEAVTGHILNRLMWYQMREYHDYKLWECFREDFKEWNKNIFLIGDTDDVQDLRNHLRESGVYISKYGKRIA